MDNTEVIYEGKAKKIYPSTKPAFWIQEFKDDATAFNGKKKGQISNKGEINNKISSRLFQYLDSHQVPTHFVKRTAPNAMEIKKLQMFKLEVIVRNIAAGSYLKRENVEEGTVLNPPILEYCLKDDDLGDPFISETEIFDQELATDDQLDKIRRNTLKVNVLLKDFFSRRNLKLVDFKLEWGLDAKKDVVLGDEISPDTCRFWDATTNEKLDKDRFRQNMGGVENAYEEVLKRVF
ncbi:MAG: phosphoribosylaminoimidazolesuccinocarboxamide synthase [Calditrichaeota bacterium]|nr:MAG: phosphoribosylaminoimidazolesuccinocarboxamide synthase [Calditrichota bacterium]